MSNNEKVKIENLVRTGTSFLVFIDFSGVSIVEMRERSEMLAKIVSKRVKNSSVLFFHDGAVREVTESNISETWRLIAPRKKMELSDKVEFPKYQKTVFDICKMERPFKKYSKRGFSHRIHDKDYMECMFIDIH
jgi:hypothetical protein